MMTQTYSFELRQGLLDIASCRVLNLFVPSYIIVDALLSDMLRFPAKLDYVLQRFAF